MSKSLHVLLVEDSEDDALLLLRELRRGGYDVTIERVETADSMRAALTQQTWDIIIADYALPHFSAPAALQLAQESNLDIPFIVVSGTIGEETAVATMRAGAHDYLMKSNMTRLAAAVARELKDAQTRRASASLRAANNALSQTLDLDVVLDTLLDYLSRLVPYDSANVMLREKGSQLTIRAIRGYEQWANPEQIRAITFDAHTHPDFQQLLMTGESMLIPDTRDHPSWQSNPGAEHIRNWLGVPLVAGGEVIGLYSIDKTEPGFFTGQHLQLAEALASQAAVAIQNARLHQQAQRHAAELEQRVAERTFELAERNEQLKELDRLKSKFVSDVTHELRTPVTNLKLYLDLWELGRPEQRAKYLAVLREQVNRLEQLIGDILNLSRLERADERPAFGPVDLNRLAARVVQTYLPHADAAGLDLRFEPDSALPPVWGKDTQLVQVVTNLVINALYYTASGHIRVSTYLDGQREQICLEVEDTGMGIAPEEQRHIFERFYRGERTGQLNIPGTGLGLAIVKEIVSQHGGAIDVRSDVDAGSTFRVCLPPAVVR